MTAELVVKLIVPIINGVFAVGVLVVGVVMNRRIKEVKSQVVNDHETNLRDESDVRHLENAKKLDNIMEEILRVRNSTTRIWIKLDKHSEKIHDLEMTKPTRGRAKND